MRKWVFLFLCTIVLQGFSHGPANNGTVLNPAFPNANTDDMFINRWKNGGVMSNVSGGVSAQPDDVDTNGYLLYANPFGTGGSGYKSLMHIPTNYEVTGDWIISATGVGQFTVQGQNVTYGATTTTCVGSSASGCDNTACTDATGYIAGTTLTITAGSSCNFVQGQPVSGAGVFTNQFGTPTIIVNTNGNTTTGNYTINFAQTVGSAGSPITIHPGFFWQYSATPVGQGVEPFNTGITPNIEFDLKKSGTASAQTNTIQNIGLYPASDATDYENGFVSSGIFRSRAKQGNFKVLRDLDLVNGNFTNCSTWSTRKPTTYIGWGGSEWRKSIYAGTASYVLNGSSNDYSITFGSGAPTDKQTLIVHWADSSTNATATFNLNSTGALPILHPDGQAATTGTVPIANTTVAIVYDALLGGWMFSGWQGTQLATSSLGLNCPVPPEVTVRIAAEIGADPWFVTLPYAADPLTDWVPSLAAYVKNNFPNMHPWFETVNETWNCQGAIVAGNYASAVTNQYKTLDPTHWTNGVAGSFCGAGGDVFNWNGKVGSVIGQAVSAVYGGNTSRYEVVVGSQQAYGPPSATGSVMSSAKYMAQDTGLIPIQAGYIQDRACNYAHYVAVANYWGQDQATTAQGIAQAWSWYNSALPSLSDPNFQWSFSQVTQFASWSNWVTVATGCGGVGGGIGKGVVQYEASLQSGGWSTDRTVGATGSNNSASCIIATGTNGAASGMTISLSGMTGGTWSTVNGNSYTVNATGLDNAHIPLTGFDCSGLGTLTGGTLTYVGSSNWGTTFFLMGYLSQYAYTASLQQLQTFKAGGGTLAAFFTLSGLLSTSYPWVGFSYTSYGYIPMGTGTLSISGTTGTLSGTVKGIFLPGMQLWAQGITVGTSIVSGVGRNSGDTFTVSNSQTVSNKSAVAVVPPPDANSSSIQQWPAYRAWNGNWKINN
jgi:hypothetical protein